MSIPLHPFFAPLQYPSLFNAQTTFQEIVDLPGEGIQVGFRLCRNGLFRSLLSRCIAFLVGVIYIALGACSPDSRFSKSLTGILLACSGSLPGNCWWGDDLYRW